MCSQPPPTTITLGAIVSKGTGRSNRRLIKREKETIVNAFRGGGIVGLCVLTMDFDLVA